MGEFVSSIIAIGLMDRLPSEADQINCRRMCLNFTEFALKCGQRLTNSILGILGVHASFAVRYFFDINSRFLNLLDYVKFKQSV